MVPSSNEHENVSADVLELRDVAGYKHEAIESSSTANDDASVSLLSMRKRRVYVPTGKFIVAQVLKTNNFHFLSSSVVLKCTKSVFKVENHTRRENVLKELSDRS
jgi:hypothetical protein